MSAPDHEPSNRPTFTFIQVVIAALACLLLGVGVGRVWTNRGEGPSSVDVGFVRDMIDHHDQAIAISLVTLAKDDINQLVRDFATEVLIFQRWEIGLMDARLGEWGAARGDLDRVAMTWMGMGAAVPTMPGMQPPEAIEALEAASGAEADRLFLTMMGEHHQGGVHMAEYAAQHGSDDRIVALAARMAANQRVEVNEYRALLDQLTGPG
ncbi:MAG: DUF305 domain-containing protein [Acidimicrobiales bacterium]